MPVMEIQGKLGPGTGTAGSVNSLRTGPTLETIVQQLNGKYYELARLGLVYHAQTAASGVAPGTAVGTTVPYVLANPAGSGKNLVVLATTLGYVSGTLGAGLLAYVADITLTDAATTGTAIVPVNGLIGGAAGVAKPFTTATVATSPTLVRPICSMSAFLATTAMVPFSTVTDDVDGAIIVQPGTAIGVQGIAAAGATPLIVIAATWAEIAV